MESVILLMTSILGFLSLLFAIVRTTSTLRRDIRGDIERLDGRMDRVEGRLDRQDGKIDALRSEMDSKMESLRTGLEQKMERGFSKVHEDHRDLRGRLDRITDNLALRGLIPTEQ